MKKSVSKKSSAKRPVEPVAPFENPGSVTQEDKELTAFAATFPAGTPGSVIAARYKEKLDIR